MHTLTLSDEQLYVINAALQEMPMRVALPIVQDINRQLSEQRAAEEQPAPPAD